MISHKTGNVNADDDDDDYCNDYPDTEEVEQNLE
jgi:hypothetical protein